MTDTANIPAGESPGVREDRYDWDEDPTAQDVIDALRMALMAQKEPAEAIKILDLLIEYAPDTVSSRGIDLLLRLVSEGVLKMSVTDES